MPDETEFSEVADSPSTPQIYEDVAKLKKEIAELKAVLAKTVVLVEEEEKLSTKHTRVTIANIDRIMQLYDRVAAIEQRLDALFPPPPEEKTPPPPKERDPSEGLYQ